MLATSIREEEEGKAGFEPKATLLFSSLLLKGRPWAASLGLNKLLEASLKNLYSGGLPEGHQREAGQEEVLCLL